MRGAVLAVALVLGLAACSAAQGQEHKPKVCIVGQEDDMPATDAVDYIRCLPSVG